MVLLYPISMTEEIFDLILGALFILLGVLILIFILLNPLVNDENEFGRAAHYQVIVLGIFFVIIGFFII